MVYGSGIYPEKFTCTIRPRSQPVEQLIVEKLLCNQPDLGAVTYAIVPEATSVACFRITLPWRSEPRFTMSLLRSKKSLQTIPRPRPCLAAKR